MAIERLVACYGAYRQGHPNQFYISYPSYLVTDNAGHFEFGTYVDQRKIHCPTIRRDQGHVTHFLKIWDPSYKKESKGIGFIYRLYCSTLHSRRSGTDHTVLPENYTVPASTS